MTLPSTLRARVEAILFDGYGSSGQTIPVGRFRRITAELAHPDAASERRVRVVLGLAVDVPEGVNACDGFALRDRALVVEVEYQRTHQGEGLSEGDDYLNGAGTDDAIADRMNTDEHTIRTALGWHEHWSGLSPHVYAIRNDGPSETEFAPTIATMRVRFVVQSRDETPGSYSP